MIVPECCPERPYLELEIPSTIQVVEGVVFKTVSRDQGHSDETIHHGSYKHSYSWFEIAVVTPSYHIRGYRQRLQNNIHAGTDFHEHITVWQRDEETDDSRLKWFDDIQPDGFIHIIPKAHPKAWRNYVKSAAIILKGKKKEIKALSR